MAAVLVQLELKGMGVFAFPGECQEGRGGMVAVAAALRLTCEDGGCPASPGSRHASPTCSGEPFLPEINGRRRQERRNNSVNAPCL